MERYEKKSYIGLIVKDIRRENGKDLQIIPSFKKPLKNSLKRRERKMRRNEERISRNRK